MSRLLCLALIVLAGRPAFAQDPPGLTVLTGGVDEYVVRLGDNLASLSSRFGTGTATLVQLNKLDKGQPLVAGRVLTIDNRHIAVIDAGASIAINIAQRMLYHFDGESVTAYPIAVGLRGWPTPVGAFTVIDKEEHPTWALEPARRLHPEDVAALFARVTIGTAGVIRYQPVLIASIDGRVYLEAHPDVYRRAPDSLQFVRNHGSGVEDRADWTAVLRVLKEQRGVAVDVTKED